MKRGVVTLEREMDPWSSDDGEVLCCSLETWGKKMVAYRYSTKSGGELRPALRRPLEHGAGVLALERKMDPPGRQTA